MREAVGGVEEELVHHRVSEDVEHQGPVGGESQTTDIGPEAPGCVQGDPGQAQRHREEHRDLDHDQGGEQAGQSGGVQVFCRLDLVAVKGPPSKYHCQEGHLCLNACSLISS